MQYLFFILFALFCSFFGSNNGFSNQVPDQRLELTFSQNGTLRTIIKDAGESRGAVLKYINGSINIQSLQTLLRLPIQSSEENPARLVRVQNCTQKNCVTIPGRYFGRSPGL